jgi:hypothetical protein
MLATQSGLRNDRLQRRERGHAGSDEAGDLAEEDRPDTTLYVDEFHNYLALPKSFDDPGRGARLSPSLVLAHQHMNQLPRPIETR